MNRSHSDVRGLFQMPSGDAAEPPTAANPAVASAPAGAAAEHALATGTGASQDASSADSDALRRLFDGTPREVLARLVAGDSLELRARIWRRLRQRCLLADAEAVQLRSLARLARLAGRALPRTDPETWIDAEIDAAIDRSCWQSLETPDGQHSEPSVPTAFATSLGLQWPLAAALINACNGQPEPARSAFHGLVLESRGLDELARESGVSASEIGRRARRVLDALLAQHQPPPSSAPMRSPSTGRST